MTATEPQWGSLIGTAIARDLERYARQVGLDVRSLLRVGAGFVMAHIDKEGGLVVTDPRAQAPGVAAKRPLYVSARIVERLTEACAVADIDDGINGLTKAIMSGVLDDFEGGDFGLILEGWDFGSPAAKAKVERKLAALASRWREEDKRKAPSPVAANEGGAS